MSIKTLKISIECGEKTCASEPSKVCQFLGKRNFGMVFVCMLWPSEENSCTLDEKNGWLQRCPNCLEAEEK